MFWIGDIRDIASAAAATVVCIIVESVADTATVWSLGEHHHNG
jgi:hypothetical protein